MASWHAGWLNPAGMELTGIAFLFTINLWSSPSQALISRFLVVQLKKTLCRLIVSILQAHFGVLCPENSIGSSLPVNYLSGKRL